MGGRPKNVIGGGWVRPISKKSKSVLAFSCAKEVNRIADFVYYIELGRSGGGNGPLFLRNLTVFSPDSFTKIHFFYLPGINFHY